MEDLSAYHTGLSAKRLSKCGEFLATFRNRGKKLSQKNVHCNNDLLWPDPCGICGEYVAI